MDPKRNERAAKKILDVFSDGRITNHDLIYVAFHTMINAYPSVVVDRIIEYTEHLKIERERMERDSRYVQDTIF